jgi:hypothetical protein
MALSESAIVSTGAAGDSEARADGEGSVVWGDDGEAGDGTGELGRGAGGGGGAAAGLSPVGLLRKFFRKPNMPNSESSLAYW